MYVAFRHSRGQEIPHPITGDMVPYNDQPVLIETNTYTESAIDDLVLHYVGKYYRHYDLKILHRVIDHDVIIVVDEKGLRFTQR